MVDSSTINGDQLRQLDENTFGHAYGRFLKDMVLIRTIALQ